MASKEISNSEPVVGKTRRLLKVEWWDAEADNSWLTEEELEKELTEQETVISVGFEIARDKNWLILGATNSKNKLFNNTIRIPVPNIEKEEVIKNAKTVPGKRSREILVHRKV